MQYVRFICYLSSFFLKKEIDLTPTIWFNTFINNMGKRKRHTELESYELSDGNFVVNE